ncbi:MAG: hypothetical protein QG623_465 [Patescibacteria group bacterium]|nr:hypothetical protein [Patescibacteria group bacterium]
MEQLTGLDWIHSNERRTTDVLLATASLMPILAGTAVLATAVFVETGTNPVLIQDRIGTEGRLFRQPKVRSHKSSRDFNDIFDPIAHADRLSRVGGFARSRHLDDLISVVNILKGDLSFWGPRPLLTADIEQMEAFLGAGEFDQWLEGYLICKKGWLSPYERWGTKEAEPNTPEAARLRAYWDNFYIENASRQLDRVLFADAISTLLPAGLLKSNKK